MDRNNHCTIPRRKIHLIWTETTTALNMQPSSTLHIPNFAAIIQISHTKTRNQDGESKQTSQY
jgi:hypothetical protein